MKFRVDIDSLAEKLGFDSEDVEMLLEVFYTSSVENLEILKKAIEERDISSIEHAAHSIKGSASNLLLEDIVPIAKEMELRAKSNDVSFAYMDEYDKLRYRIENLLTN